MKESQYNFVGKNSQQPEIRKKATEILDQKFITASETEKSNEVPKTEQEIKEIKEVESSINQEMVDLGLTPDYKIEPEDVHILLKKRTNPFSFTSGSHDVFESGTILNRESGKTLYVQLVHKILSKFFQSKFNKINTGEKLKEQQVSIFTHESVHDKSIHKYKISNEKDGSPKVSPYRLGYSILSEKHEDCWLDGFNEAVTEKTAMDIMNKKRKDDEKELISKTKYKFNIEIVDKIAEQIALAKGETKEDAWKRFKVGQFTGNMMHLRDVERVFGEDSLRVLASMTGIVRKEWKDAYKTYFTTDDESKRKKLARKILG